MDPLQSSRSHLLNELPLPVAQLLRRGLNAKSAVDRHQLFYFAGEASLKLAAAARVGVWLDHCLEPGSSGARRLEALVLPSVGHWLALLRDLSADLAHRPETRLLPLANVDSGLRRSRPDWQGVARLAEVATAAGSLADEVATRAKSGGIVGFFELLVAYRNEVMAHGAHRGVAFYSEMADALDAALVDVLSDPAWLGGLELGVARLGPEEGGGPRVAWQVLRGLGGVMRPPRAETGDIAGDAGCRPGELYLLAPGVRIPLHPLLVFREDDLGREQVGFLNRTVRREGSAGLEVRRVDFLDYVSGERLQGIDARAEVQRLFSRLRGEEVAEPVLDASLALDAGETADRIPEPASSPAAVLGDFELEGELGRGGMGVVYRARQRSLNRQVALKVLPPDLAADPVTLARFRREITALARCDHPNVVRILATGLDGDRWWYAMELVDGVDLAAVFEVLSSWRGQGARLTAGHLQAAVSSSAGLRASRSAASGEPRASALPDLPKLDPPPAPDLGEGREDFDRRLAELMAGACRGVEHLHELGIVHRDLKPGNLMLTTDGSRMVVTDLGLAQLREASLQLTRTAAGLLGTLRYMAPEQLHGRLLEIDHRADVYGLGATLYELACLKPVYEGATEQELLRQKIQEEPTAPRKVRPDLPEDLATILETALRRRPADRYSSAAALACDLESFARHEPIHARPASRLYHLKLFVERNRRMVGVAAVAFSIAILSLIGGFIARGLEAARANRAAAEAERRRGQAEDLIQFMLGDLRERLEPVGRLDALDGAATKALDYIASVDANKLTDADRFRRSRALTQIGEVRIAQGNLSAAKPALLEAHALSTDLVGRQSQNGDWLMSLGAIEFWLGNVDWLQGNLAAAEEHFHAYLAVADRLVAIDAAKPEWRMEQAYAHSNLGTVQNARGNVDAALEQFRFSVEIERALVAAEPRWQEDLANGLSWLGEVLYGRGELEESRTFYEEACAAFKRLTESAPDDTGNRNLLGLQRRKLGTTLEGLGRQEEAIEEYSQSLAIHRQLAELDPANADWRREVAISHLRLGSALASSKAGVALRHLRQSVSLLGALHRDDPSNRERQLDLVDARIALARGHLAARAALPAVAEARIALADLGPAVGSGVGGDDRARQQLAGEAHLALGDALAAASRETEARAAWEEALSLLQPLSDDARDPRLLAPLALALSNLGRRAEAQAVVDRLWAGGYRRAPIGHSVRRGLMQANTGSTSVER